jgi:hypothetical protein
MNHGMWMLFTIPAICIVVIAISQFGDEMFKKKFIIERRRKAAADSISSSTSQNRRYNDPKGPASQSEPTPEPLAATDTRSLETSGIGN